MSCDSDIYLGVEKTTPLGLIINELISNSVKHAFDDIQTPKVEIILVKNGQEYTLTYRDNGKGYVNATESLGSLLIKTLSETQLKGSYTISSDEQYRFELTFA